MNLKTRLLSTIALVAFGTAQAQDKPIHVPSNIISMSPLQISDQGLGIGVSFEKYLDKKKGLISFYMPVAVAFQGSGDADYNAYYFMPGIKIYPTGNDGVVKYAIGPNLTFLSDRTDTYDYIYDPATGQGFSQYDTKDRFAMGMMINNSLNINPSEHLHMALEFGLGFSYFSSNESDGTLPFTQLGFQLGYRF
jgi:hypothetical protein